VRDFRNIDVWKKSHALTLLIYKMTAAFPKEETYGLTSQIRRASSSIGANIAEGCGSDCDPEFARYLLNAMKSATELEYHLLLARDLDLLAPDKYSKVEPMITEVKRMLASFIRKLRPRTEWPQS
jgi:four helix bundle protein